jgi:hypothetical protein
MNDDTILRSPCVARVVWWKPSRVNSQFGPTEDLPSVWLVATEIGRIAPSTVTEPSHDRLFVGRARQEFIRHDVTNLPSSLRIALLFAKRQFAGHGATLSDCWRGFLQFFFFSKISRRAE